MLSEQSKTTIRTAYRSLVDKGGLRPRHGQRVMIAEIANTIGMSDAEASKDGLDRICVIEAGTGTGKTVGYLLSAIVAAKEADKKLIISTATIALQEQIVNKDIPEVLKNSGLNFSYTLAKGRGRYACPAKIQSFLESSGAATQDDWFLDGLMVSDDKQQHLMETFHQKLESGQWNGDKDEWVGALTDAEWASAVTNRNACAGRKCDHYEKCPFYKARNGMNACDVIVANHDLVLADLGLGGGFILPEPEKCIYVFDEGHKLPEKALGHFSHAVRLQWAQKFYGIATKALTECVAHFDDQSLEEEAKLTIDTLASARNEINDLKTAFSGIFIEALSIGSTSRRKNDPVIHRYTMGVVGEGERLAVESLTRTTSSIVKHMAAALETIKKLNEERPGQEEEKWAGRVAAVLDQCSEFDAAFSCFCEKDKDQPSARWVQFLTNSEFVEIEICSARISAADALNEMLWHKAYGAIVVSATLTTNKTFERYKLMSGLKNSASFHVVESPFDYPRVAKLIIPKMDFEPSDYEEHTAFITEYVKEQNQKGILVLFTSRKQMEDVHARLPRSIAGKVIVQGVTSKQEAIKTHKMKIDANEQSILFGLDSFSEGLDLPRAYCENVIIAKLPFAVPDDPIEATLAEWYESKGKNPFMDISVPNACIKLKQMVGRLIRSEEDTGVVSILDSRLTKKRYGKMLINSLPPMLLSAGATGKH